MGSDPELLGDDAVRLDRRRREGDDTTPPVEPRPARPLPRWVKLVMAAVVLALGVGWYVDHRVATHETRALAACDVSLTAASHAYDVRMGSVYDYVRPALVGKAGQAQLLSTLMAAPARQVLPTAEASLARCGSFRVLAWHSTNVARRNAATAYASALVHRLQVVAGARQDFQIADPQLARLRKAAGVPAALGAL